MHSPRLQFTEEEVRANFDGIMALLHDEILSEQLRNFPGYDNLIENVKTVNLGKLILFYKLKESKQLKTEY